MTYAERLSPPGPMFAIEGDQATRREHFVYVFFGLWLLAGLSLDGWAHRNRPELESFFTPWHAVFYAGFIGGAA